MTNVIISADAYGRCACVSEAIEDCAAAGAISAASARVNSRWSESVARFRARFPRISLGLQWTLLEGHPVLAPDVVPSLLNVQRRFPSREIFGRRLAYGRLQWIEVHNECLAQYRRFVALAGQPDFWCLCEGQTGGLWRRLMKLADELAVPGARNPFREWRVAHSDSMREDPLHGFMMRSWLLRDAAVSLIHRRFARHEAWMPGRTVLVKAAPGGLPLRALGQIARTTDCAVEVVLRPAKCLRQGCSKRHDPSEYACYEALMRGDMRERLLNAGMSMVPFEAPARVASGRSAS